MMVRASETIAMMRMLMRTMTHSPTEHPRGVGSEENERMSLLVSIDCISLMYV